jgi:prevent-host-death family protein
MTNGRWSNLLALEFASAAVTKKRSAMIITLSQGQAELPRLVEIASQGEDVIITVEGKPKARLTRADAAENKGDETPLDMAAWLKDLKEARRKYSTVKPGLSAEQILEKDRSNEPGALANPDNRLTLIDRLISLPIHLNNFTPSSRAEIYGAE